MKILKIIIFIVLFCCMNNSFITAQQKKHTVAIIEFTGKNIDKETLAVLTNRFGTNLVKTQQFDVLERDKMNEILNEQNFIVSDNCNSAECAVQVGQLLGVEYMVGGFIGKIGNIFTIDIRIIDVSSGKILRTESLDYDGQIEGLLGVMSKIATSISEDENIRTSRISKGIEGQILYDGTFFDTRDGKKYKTVKLGNQIWMAENLNYSYVKSFCYQNNETYCNNYGRLYMWNEIKDIAPPGWRVPTKDDWKKLIEYFGNDKLLHSKFIQVPPNGFGTILGGFRDIGSLKSGPVFSGKDMMALFWSITEKDKDNAYSCGVYGDKFATDKFVNVSYHNKDKCFFVRCIKE